MFQKANSQTVNQFFLFHVGLALVLFAFLPSVLHIELTTGNKWPHCFGLFSSREVGWMFFLLSWSQIMRFNLNTADVSSWAIWISLQSPASLINQEEYWWLYWMSTRLVPCNRGSGGESSRNRSIIWRALGLRSSSVLKFPTESLNPSTKGLRKYQAPSAPPWSNPVNPKESGLRLV